MPKAQTFRYKRTLRSSVNVLVAIVTACAAAGIATAQQYPAKPIRLVVSLAPGGGGDTLGRYMDAAASTNEEFALKIKTDMDKLAKLVRDTGLR